MTSDCHALPGRPISILFRLGPGCRSVEAPGVNSRAKPAFSLGTIHRNSVSDPYRYAVSVFSFGSQRIAKRGDTVVGIRRREQPDAIGQLTFARSDATRDGVAGYPSLRAGGLACHADRRGDSPLTGSIADRSVDRYPTTYTECASVSDPPTD